VGEEAVDGVAGADGEWCVVAVCADDEEAGAACCFDQDGDGVAASGGLAY
jgi:hypothetical protein